MIAGTYIIKSFGELTDGVRVTQTGDFGRDRDKLKESTLGEKAWDPHLRSTNAVSGHNIEANLSPFPGTNGPFPCIELLSGESQTFIITIME